MPTFEVMDVDLYVDPTCAWSWTAFQWLDEVAPARQLYIRLRPYSLALRGGVDHLSEPLRTIRATGHRGLRVLAALEDESRCAYFHALAGSLYMSLAAGRSPVIDIAAALAAAGSSASYEAADDERWDDVIRAAMTSAQDAVGMSGEYQPTIPVVAFASADHLVAFQGPLLDPVPTGRDALLLWDAVEMMGRLPGVYELSRPHGRHSLVTAPRVSAMIERAI